jgi:Xaa-Pro dipeptidase
MVLNNNRLLWRLPKLQNKENVLLTEFKMQRINCLMEDNGLDMLIGSSNDNIYYMTGFVCMGQLLLQKTQAYALYNRKNGAQAIVIPFAEAASAVEKLNDISLYCYGNFKYDYANSISDEMQIVRDISDKGYTSPESALIQAIMVSGLKKGKIGIDENRITHQTWCQIANSFPEIEFIPAASIFGRIRMIKHEREIFLLERAAEIAEESLLAVIDQLKVGMTENDIGHIFAIEVSKRGADPFFHVVTADIRSALVDTTNSERKIADGSLIRFDIGCNFQGYKSDIARTVVVGNFDQKIKDYYSYIQQGEEMAIEAIKPGVTAEKIFNIALGGTRKGIPDYQRHHCGHGIGLEIYDPPSIAPAVYEQLQPSMVLCIETPYYILGWGGIQVEDTIVVTDNGHRYLTKTKRDLIKVCV